MVSNKLLELGTMSQVIFLLIFGFINTIADPSIFIYSSNIYLIYLLVYVDDLIVTGNNDKFIMDFI